MMVRLRAQVRAVLLDSASMALLHGKLYETK